MFVDENQIIREINGQILNTLLDLGYTTYQLSKFLSIKLNRLKFILDSPEFVGSDELDRIENFIANPGRKVSITKEDTIYTENTYKTIRKTSLSLTRSLLTHFIKKYNFSRDDVPKSTISRIIAEELNLSYYTVKNWFNRGVKPNSVTSKKIVNYLNSQYKNKNFVDDREKILKKLKKFKDKFDIPYKHLAKEIGINIGTLKNYFIPSKGSYFPLKSNHYDKIYDFVTKKVPFITDKSYFKQYEFNKNLHYGNPIFKIDKNNNKVLYLYTSINDARKDLKAKTRSNIRRAAINNYIAYGYKWSYCYIQYNKDTEKLDKINKINEILSFVNKGI